MLSLNTLSLACSSRVGKAWKADVCLLSPALPGSSYLRVHPTLKHLLFLGRNRDDRGTEITYQVTLKHGGIYVKIQAYQIPSLPLQWLLQLVNNIHSLEL